MGYILKVRDDKGNVIGIPAIQGENGKDGKDGIDGKDGVNGKDGTNGKDGIDGKNGIDGKDGSTPFIGNNGNWWIGGADTGVTARTGLVTGTFNVIVADSTEYNSTLAVSIALDFTPKLIVAVRKDGEEGLCVWSGGRFQFASPSHWRNEVAQFSGGEITAQWETTENGTFNGEWSYIAAG